MSKFILLIVATLSGKKGVIDYSGAIVIPFVHETLHRFSEGRFVASKYIQSVDGERLLYGAYDETGIEVIPFVFDNLDWIKEGRLTGKLDGKAVIIDLYGNLLLESDYDRIEPFNEFGYARVTKGSKQGFIDQNFREIIPPTYDWSNSLNRYGKWHVKWTMNLKEALIDTNHKIIFEAPDKHIIKIGGVLNDFVITHDINNHFQCGLFNLEGMILLPHVYEDLSLNLRGLFESRLLRENIPIYVFGKNNQLGSSELFVIIGDGQCQLKCRKPVIQYGNGIDCFVFGSEVDGIKRLGLMNSECEQLIEPQYQEIYFLFQENDLSSQTSLFRTLKDDKYGITRGDGTEIIKPQFPKFISIGNGLFNIDDQNRSMIFNLSGEVIFESESIRVWYNIINSPNDFNAKDSTGKYGIYNLEKKEWVIEPIYEWLEFPDIIEE